MAKVKPDEKNMHAGHRMRVIESYSKIDLEALSPHQVLEYILFYVFPRGDVNPLAHRLLDKYGSVQNVLDANEAELTKIYGINIRSAKLITGFSKIFDYYINGKLSKKLLFKNYNDIYDYCESLLRFYNHEVLFAIGLNASNHVVGKRMLGNGDSNMVVVDTHELINFINESKCVYIILTHSHPGGSCLPSENDVEGDKVIQNVVKYMHVNYIDHLIVGDDGIFSLHGNKKVRQFLERQQVQQVVKKLKNN